jgi:hypothetical protein
LRQITEQDIQDAERMRGRQIDEVLQPAPVSHSVECKARVAQYINDKGQSSVIAMFTISCANLWNGDEVIGYFALSRKETKHAMEIVQGTLDYLNTHLPEHLLIAACQLVKEGLITMRMNSTLLTNKEYDSEVLKGIPAKAAKDLILRTKKRLALPGRGGSRPESTPEQRQRLLSVYEETLERLRRKDSTLPAELIGDLARRFASPSELARSHAAKTCRLNNTTYLVKILDKARKERAGIQNKKATKAARNGRGSN